MCLDNGGHYIVALFSQYTSISAERIEEYLGDEKHTIADIFRRPKHIVRNEKEMMAVDNLRELRDIYNALKTYDRGDALNCPDKVFNYFRAVLLNVQFEDYSAVAFLDTKNRVIDVGIISGSFDQENIPDIMKGALKKNARAVMLCHNHSSGDPAPSPGDYHFTQQLWRAGWVVSVTVVDHIVVANGRFVSLLEESGNKDFSLHGESPLPLLIREQLEFDMLDSSQEAVTPLGLVGYEREKARFVDLFSKYTSISIDRVEEYLNNHNVVDLLQRPTDITRTEKELIAVEGLREMRNMYEVLKTWEKGNTLTDPCQTALNYFQAALMDVQDREYFNVMFFDAQNEVLGVTTTRGTVDQQYVYPREIMKVALVKNAKSIILCHNHPSGDPTPSREDINITQRIYAAGRVIGVDVRDHFIVGNEKYTSLRLDTGSSDFGFSLSGLRAAIETGRVVQEGIRERIMAVVDKTTRANKIAGGVKLKGTEETAR